jgi:hypothetical protein
MKLESKKAQIYDRSYTEYTGNKSSNFYHNRRNHISEEGNFDSTLLGL